MYMYMYSVGGVVRLQERKPTPESVFLRSLKKKGLGGRHPLHTKSSTAYTRVYHILISRCCLLFVLYHL